MSFALTTGGFAAIEKEFCRAFGDSLRKRIDPLRDQHLVIVPTSALRKHVLQQLFESGCVSLTSVRLVSLNGLAQEILMDSIREPFSALDDPNYFALALQSAAKQLGLRAFEPYRTARGLLSTIRDLVDGLLTPELMAQLFEQESGDSALIDVKALHELKQLYSGFLQHLNAQNVVNVQYASALTIDSAAGWLQRKNVRALFIYGFYDVTPAQFDLLETLVRQVHTTDGAVAVYFPFAVAANSVEHPAEYAQEFYDTMFALAAKLGGEVRAAADTPKQPASGLDSSFFRDSFGGETPAVDLFSAGSPHEEAWVVAKTILQLVLREGVRFDQIGVISRSLEPFRAVFQQVFAENQIPHTLPKEPALCSSAAGHFVYLLLLMKQSHLNHNLVFELLCSPLLQEPFTPAGAIRELLEILFITNSDDWHRLNPLTEEEKKLPEIFELEDDDPRTALYRRAATYLTHLKKRMDEVPQSGRLADFTKALEKLVADLADRKRFEEAGGVELELLLERLGDLPLEAEYSLNEFVEIFRDYLQWTPSIGAGLRPAEDLHTSRVRAGLSPAPTEVNGVAIGDIMRLRGVSFDYVFVVGLNHDVFPLRSSEDPFLPDGVRSAIRATTGAGPYPKRRNAESDEELLLFTLAMRAARRALYLSYQRSDADGRMKSPSIYIEEVSRLLPQRKIQKFPRHLEKRFEGAFLPSPPECSTLVGRYSPHEVIGKFYNLGPDYVDGAFAFAEKLNSMDRTAAGGIDGMLQDSEELWKQLYEGKLRFSYSRIKDYVRCAFSFYSDRILRLQPSPFKPTQIPHDLTPLVCGRLAESVVKEAIPKLRAGGTSVDEAVRSAENKIRRKYAAYLPKVLVDYYLQQFSRAANVLLEYLQAEGYDFAFAEVPGREYTKNEITLLEDRAGLLKIYGIPDLLLYGPKKLIGEMKWGAAATADTADAMFMKGELQYCFYPELERQNRQLLEPVDFRYFRLNKFAELGSPSELEKKFRELYAPNLLDKTLRVFGLAPTQENINNGFVKLKDIGRSILNGEFKILEDPGDYFSPCTTCGFILICRRTHSATLLRAKKEYSTAENDEEKK